MYQRKTLQKLLILGLCLFFIPYFLVPYLLIKKSSPDLELSKLKKILYWTPHSNSNLGQGPDTFEKCKVSNCYITEDKTFLPHESFDAIIFNTGGGKYEKQTDDNLPKTRHAKQTYIFFNMDPPIFLSSRFLDKFQFFYNWTMTYRKDSDVYSPAGVVEARRTIDYNYNPQIANKKRSIAWLEGDCTTFSRREMVHNRLKKLLQIDSYGPCGTLDLPQCPRNQLDDYYGSRCNNFFSNNYKFLLVFEDAMCNDYVAEKLYDVFNLNTVVPIVLGFTNYSRITPPKSVVDVRDFGSLELLARHVLMLEKNDDMYAEYFRWRRRFIVKKGKGTALCNLCEKLNEPYLEHKSYDIAKWWKDKNQSKCVELNV